MWSFNCAPCSTPYPGYFQETGFPAGMSTPYTYPCTQYPVNMYPNNAYAVSNGVIQTSATPGFVFKKRFERVDWKKLASVDVDAISRNVDFNALQDNIMNVTFCNIESEIDTRMIDPNFIKLFKLAQLTIEYLLHSQNYLSNMVTSLEQKLIKVKEELDKTNKLVDKLKDELNEVKKESHKRKKMIIAQQQIIQAGTDSYNKCPLCTKAFVNQSYLQSHLMRRHHEYIGSISQPQVPQTSPSPQAPPPQPTVSQPIVTAASLEVKRLEKELEEIKQRLSLTESELVEERNARNSLTKRETDEVIRHEKELERKFQKLQQENEEKHKREIDRIIETFTKELREMSEKYEASQEMLSKLQSKLAKSSNLGMIHDDIETERELLEKQRQEIAMLKERLEAQFNESLEEKLAEQENKWIIKLNALRKEHKRKLNEMQTKVEEIHIERESQMEIERQYKEQISQADFEQKKEEEKRRKQLEKEKQNEAIRDKREEKPKTEAVDKQLAERTPVMKRTGIGNTMYDDDDSVTERTEEQSTEFEATSTFTTTRGTLSLGQFGTSLSMTEPPSERLLEAKQKNPRLLDQYRKEAYATLEQELRKRGIPENAQGLSDNIYNNKLQLLKNERKQLAEKYRNIFDIRQYYINQIEHQAKVKYAEQQKQAPSKAKSPSQPMVYSTTTPGKPSPIQQSAPASRDSRPATSKQPMPAPRATSPTTRQPSPAQRTINRTSVGSSMATTVASSTWDDEVGDEETNFNEMDERRPAVRVPGTPVKQQHKPIKNTRFAEDDSEEDSEDEEDEDDEDEDEEDDDDNWDDISGLDSMEPSPRKTQSTNSTSRVTGSAVKPRGDKVAQLSRTIELQLSGRKPNKKPIGGVDVMKTSSAENTAKSVVYGGDSDDDDDDSLASVTSYEDDKVSGQRAVNRRAAGSRSTLTDDTNTYGTSVWGSSSKGVSSVQPGANSSHTNTYTGKTSEATESDEWDTENIDT